MPSGLICEEGGAFIDGSDFVPLTHSPGRQRSTLLAFILARMGRIFGKLKP